MSSHPLPLSFSNSSESDHVVVGVDAESSPREPDASGEESQTTTDPIAAEAPRIVDATPPEDEQSQQVVDEEDDDLTIIGLDPNSDQRGDQNAAALAWIEQNGPEMEERRRNVLLRELQRVQRASFIHFVLLCLIPTSLLFVVLATVLGDQEECSSDATRCAEEARTFINAFTTRCICDAIDVNEGPD